MVSTLDFESSDPSSSLGGTSRFHFLPYKSSRVFLEFLFSSFYLEEVVELEKKFKSFKTAFCVIKGFIKSISVLGPDLQFISRKIKAAR